MCRKLFLLTFFVVVLGLTGSASAQLIVYEPFDYPANGLSGNDGGSGWNGAWDGGQQVTAPGLDFSPLSVKGNKATVVAADSFRNLPEPMGDDETQLWISFIGQADQQPGADMWGGVSFHEPDESLFLGVPWQAGPDDKVWGLDTKGDENRLTEIPITEKIFFVVRIDFNTDGDNDTVTAWVRSINDPDPFDLTDETAFAQYTTRNIEFSRVRIAGAQPVNFDEIRLGMTLEDVLELPRAMDNWEAAVAPAAPGFLATNIADGLYDIGAFSGDITYEFAVRSNPDETEASMALIGRRQFGDTQAGLKFEQWNNTGTYGATLFGVVDLDFGIANHPGVDTHLVFVSSEDASTTALYVNGVYQASVDRAITLSGLVGIGYGAQGEDGTGVFDNFDGDIFGVAIYDTALSDEEIAAHSDAFFAPPDVTAPGDIVKGVPDEPRDGSVAGWPDGEFPGLAVDDDTSTKFLHFKGELEPTGFQVTPAAGPSIVTGLAFTTANDAPERDPISYELSGSNESIDGPYELIASGDIVDFAQADAWPRFTMNATQILFYNNVAYAHYQVLFPAVRDAASANSMQIAEVKLLGVPAPAPPIAHYKLDDGEGVIAVDSSGNGLDGILIGDPLWSAGVLGGALDFDGVDDYVDCGNDTIFSITDAFSLSVWINWRMATGSWQTVVAKGDNAWRLARGGGDTQTMDFGFTDGGPRGWLAVRTASEVPLGEWHHVTVTIDTIDGAKIYLDGVLEGTNPDTGGITVGDFPVFIGENSQATGRFWDGLIDDVRIYDRVLSAEEISGLSGNILANGGFENGVVEWGTYGDLVTIAEVVQVLEGAAIPEDPIEGSSALHVVVADAGANFWDAGLQHTGHVFEAGKQYTLSVWLKSKSGTLDINLKPERGESPWEGYGEQIVTITEEWAQYSVTTPVIDAEVVPATITFHIAFAPGDFWVDGARWTEVN